MKVTVNIVTSRPQFAVKLRTCPTHRRRLCLVSHYYNQRRCARCPTFNILACNCMLTVVRPQHISAYNGAERPVILGAERPILWGGTTCTFLGAERPTTWGGTTHYVGRIDPRGADRPGADRPWGGSTGTLASLTQ